MNKYKPAPDNNLTGRWPRRNSMGSRRGKRDKQLKIKHIARQAEERIRIAENKIESLARFPSENPNPVLRVNPEGIILYANKACNKLSGFSTIPPITDFRMISWLCCQPVPDCRYVSLIGDRVK